jgi:hypothetical protein
MRLHGLALVHHQRAVLEVADPQGAGLVPGPAATHFFFGDAQLSPGGAFTPQMPIERAPWNLASELPLEDAVEDLVGAVRLLLFQLYGAGQQVGVTLPRFSPIGTPTAIQSGHALGLQPPPLTAEGAHREPSPLSVGQPVFRAA